MTWQHHSMPRVRVGLAQTGPTRARQSPFETQSELTIDRSMLTVDLAHMLVSQRLGTHMSVGDVMMTSRGTHTAGVMSC